MLTIVGVIPNVRLASPRQRGVVTNSAEPVLYRTYAANPTPSATILVRSSAGPGRVAGFCGMHCALSMHISLSWEV